jgi:flagellar biogenesis protein FliO
MTKGKIRVIVILAALIFAGGLLSAARRVAATSSQQTDSGMPARPDVAENNSSVSQAVTPVSTRELFYKMMLSAGLVIGLGIAAVYVSKKLLPRITNLPNKKIRVLETAHIAPRKGLHLVEVGARQLLIASTNEQITMLADVTESEPDFAYTLPDRSTETLTPRFTRPFRRGPRSKESEPRQNEASQALS